MLIIRTKVKPSRIHGLGLFTLEPLRKRQRIWKFNPIIDQVIDKRLMWSLPLLTREYMSHFTWQDENGNYFISLDNSKFMNHSDDANTESRHPKSPFCYANRVIAAGEELTCNYETLGPDYQKLPE